MTGKTHITGGIAAGLAYSYFSGMDPIILTGGGIIGALLPDICHSGSMIGRKLPVTSRIVNLIFGHRSFTHSLLFLVIMAFLLKAFQPYDAVTAGIVVGMASHYILDMGTKRGIQLFFPLDYRVRFPLTTKTGSIVEEVIFSLLALASFYYGYQAIYFYI
ncbi:metal-dependent hydrolase [Salinicoccus kekensis]|uniref:Inner membrane protein n=1 Tax=Salinicoccus kekensis TaxID=714307 RepID=A0A285UFG6_9STAP|nr:metal-dependent hydrolase [Salinicoccus kekensis]SOC40559.1 inner membrane protein [Salinicoccus kekensis]